MIASFFSFPRIPTEYLKMRLTDRNSPGPSACFRALRPLRLWRDSGRGAVVISNGYEFSLHGVQPCHLTKFPPTSYLRDGYVPR